MNKETIKEFLEPDWKKIIVWVFLGFLIFFFFYSMQYSILYYDQHEVFPERLSGHLPFVITLLILSFCIGYPISCLLVRKSEKFRFLKPNLFKIKVIIFLLLYVLLVSYLRKIPFSLPSGFEIGGVAHTLIEFAVFIFLPFVFYSCISYFQYSALLHKILKLDWSKFIFSIFLCLILSHFLYYTQRSSAPLVRGCEYYYFPFYTHFHTDVIFGPSLDALVVNFILGCILVFPVSIFLSFFETVKSFKKFEKRLYFIKPSWNKVLVLLILVFILIEINLPLTSMATASFGFDENILLIISYGLLWYMISCLITFAYDEFISRKQYTKSPAS